MLILPEQNTHASSKVVAALVYIHASMPLLMSSKKAMSSRAAEPASSDQIHLEQNNLLEVLDTAKRWHHAGVDGKGWEAEMAEPTSGKVALCYSCIHYVCYLHIMA